MGASFDVAIQTVFKHEGGLVDDKVDPGGITNFGISLRYLKTLGIDGDFDHDGVVGPGDIRSLSAGKAMDIYRYGWWDKYCYGRFDSQRLATKVFDTAVNMGNKPTHRILQRALGLSDDGILGPATLAAANAADENVVVEAFKAGQEKYYRDLAEEKPTLAKFLKGWEIRAAQG